MWLEARTFAALSDLEAARHEAPDLTGGNPARGCVFGLLLSALCGMGAVVLCVISGCC